MSDQPQRTDEQIRHDVLQELRCDSRLEGSDVGVEVMEQVVTLTGTVTSWSARHHAQEAAHRVRGVFDVANAIRVVLPGAHERSDTELAHAVRRALHWDATVPSDRIRSTVSEGVVTLEGSVEYGNQREDAAACVRNLTGVRLLRNWIEIEPPATPIESKALRRAIHEALQRRADRAAAHVQIGVSGGRVTLAGEVGSWRERRVIEGVVRGTPGVVTVEDKLRPPGA